MHAELFMGKICDVCSNIVQLKKKKSGKLRKGMAGSTINAYTAYFVPPTPNARVRMAVLDDDGGVTYIDDVREDADATGEAEQIYRLDGTKHATLTKGINIVKMANGEVRKVLK